MVQVHREAPTREKKKPVVATLTGETFEPIATARLRQLAKRAICRRDTPAGKVAGVHRLIAEGDAATGAREKTGEPTARNRYRRALWVGLKMGPHVTKKVLGYDTDRGLAEGAEMVVALVIELRRVFHEYHPGKVAKNLHNYVNDLNARYVGADLPGARKVGKKYKKQIDAVGKLPASEREAAYSSLLSTMLVRRFLMLGVGDPEEMKRQLISNIQGSLDAV